jgi:hypothetical protein
MKKISCVLLSLLLVLPRSSCTDPPATLPPPVPNSAGNPPLAVGQPNLGQPLGAGEVPASLNSHAAMFPVPSPSQPGGPAAASISTSIPMQVVGSVSIPPPATTECKVLPGTTGNLVQVLLFLACCCALFAKFKREHGGRDLCEFLLDSSKQLFGAGLIHVLNLYFAQRLEKHFEAVGDECHWYWVNIVVDCTLGVAVEYLLLRCLMIYIANLCAGREKQLETGVYKNEDGKFESSMYLKQLVFWLLIVTLMKLSMVVIMMLFHSALLGAAKLALAPFAFNATLTLLVVMIITPFIMNTFQFWMVDNLLKKKRSNDDDDNMIHEGMEKTRIQHGDL